MNANSERNKPVSNGAGISEKTEKSEKAEKIPATAGQGGPAAVIQEAPRSRQDLDLREYFKEKYRDIDLSSEVAFRAGIIKVAIENNWAAGEKDQAVYLIKQLYERFGQERSEFYVEFRGIPGRPEQPVREKFIRYDRIEAEIDGPLGWTAEGYNVYFGVNPRPAPGKKKQDDVVDVVSFWIDVDSKNFKEGKAEAKKRVFEFPLKPNIIVDSGRGYHCYWILEEPIVGRTEAQSKEIKQILSGLAVALGADKQTFNFDRLMRLPGTPNLKDPARPRRCSIVQVNREYFYSLGDFDTFRDNTYREPDKNGPFVEFEGETQTFDVKNAARAHESIKRLKISDKIKRLIISGELLTGPNSDKTRSGRDMAIILALIAAGYDSRTIQGIFFNPLLGCSDRIRGKRSQGQAALQYDMTKARKLLHRDRPPGSRQVKEILDIKSNPQLKAEEKLQLISKYVVEDLFSNGGGLAYKNEAARLYYFFDSGRKLLMDIEGSEFGCFLKSRFELPDKDLAEVLSWVKTHVWQSGEEIEPHNFAYYNPETGVLYISNHDNRTFRLRGDDFDVVDNGADGVIFEFRPEYTTLNLGGFAEGKEGSEDADPAAAVDYMAGGFDWEKFRREGLLYRHLIEKANFAREEKHNLSAEEQQYLLTIYFYSLFFETLQEEKPILCLQGVKASGKSFIVTATGKLIFGPAFLPSHLSDSPKDFKVALTDNYYLVFDNLDTGIDPKIINDFCVAATGGSIKSRKLYTDRDEVNLRPRVFLVITSRDPKFKREDFVSRLILFNTEKIHAPKSKSALFKEILENRTAVWTEILVNLNSIVRLLQEKHDWNPPGVFRIADWELFAKKIHNDSAVAKLNGLLLKMNKEKNKFSLEDDPLYTLLRACCYDRGESIDGLSSSELYAKLEGIAIEEKNRDFSFRYKSTVALGKRLANVAEELADEFDFRTFVGRGRATQYYIGRLPAASAASDLSNSTFPPSDWRSEGLSDGLKTEPLTGEK